MASFSFVTEEEPRQGKRITRFRGDLSEERHEGVLFYPQLHVAGLVMPPVRIIGHGEAVSDEVPQMLFRAFLQGNDVGEVFATGAVGKGVIGDQAQLPAPDEVMVEVVICFRQVCDDDSTTSR